MAAHAKTPTRKVIDPAIAYLTLAVAFFQLVARLIVGAVKPPQREVQWPTGADEQWAEELHRLAQEAPMRDEVRV
jgi:hypothetical protein